MALLRTMNWAAAGLHLAQALIVCGLIVWLDSRHVAAGVFPLYKTVHVWYSSSSAAANNITATSAAMMVDPGIVIETRMERAGTLDVRYVIACFFALSAGFQAAAGFLDIMDPYFRFIEYAFSASAMTMAIAVEAGVDDIYTLQAMFVLMFTTMVFGILADLCPQRAWLPHMAGWITFLSAYSPILDAFLQSNARSAITAPGFVSVIVFLQFFLFACFGGVQAYSLIFFLEPTARAALQQQQQQQQLLPLEKAAYDAADDNDDGLYYNAAAGSSNGDKQLMAYVVLSLTAKTLLAWLILSPVLVVVP